MNYFYELFLKTRYTNDFTVGDLKKYSELIMLSDIDFKKVEFSLPIQKKVLGRYVTSAEKRIDKVILHSDRFAFMALSFVEIQLNPYEQDDESREWPYLKAKQKALLLKYLVDLKLDRNSSEYLLEILKQNLDAEMIPERFFKSNYEEVQVFIKQYEPTYVSSLQLSIGDLV